MLAGATGMDLALLVVAADDSIKPQTLEHFDILRLLDLRAGLVLVVYVDCCGLEDWEGMGQSKDVFFQAHTRERTQQLV